MAHVKVYVTLKPSLLDAQGRVVHHALRALGYDTVEDVRIGKYIELEVEDSVDSAAGGAKVREMCERLLANPVIEDFRFEVTP